MIIGGFDVCTGKVRRTIQRWSCCGTEILWLCQRKTSGGWDENVLLEVDRRGKYTERSIWWKNDSVCVEDWIVRHVGLGMG